MITGKQHMSRKLSGLRAGLFCFALFVALMVPGTAKAHCNIGCCLTVVVPTHVATRAVIVEEHTFLRVDVFGVSAGILPFPERPDPPLGLIQEHELFLIEQVFEPLILPALMMMTEQLSSIMMEQMLIVGAFFDAKQQLETQMLFQELTARAHKDYHPSFGMCEFGSSMRSLAAADFKGDLSVVTLNKRFMDRQLGTGASVGAGGPANDRASDDTAVTPTPYNRLGYFLQNTCDYNDLNRVDGRDDTGLFLCADQPPENGWVNRDIDWNNTVMSPRTINVAFDQDASDNSRLFEMSNNLYGHVVFSRPDGSLLNYAKNHGNFLDSRAVTAKRSVAQNSFDSIVGLKTRGTSSLDNAEFNAESTSEFMRFFLVELGFPEDEPNLYHRYMFHKSDEVDEALMDETEDQISYYGQMEVLAKKIYQRPEFYTNLYDKPANVKRKSAAMQAIKLMLERDIFDSQIRSEAILSMILELKVVEEQQNVENKLGLIKERVR